MIHAKIPPSIEDVRAAAGRLKGKATVTPLLPNDVLGSLTGTNAFVKAECLQRTGSFKFRGAYNSLAVLPQEKRDLGVVACSSGNHGQGIAEAARLFGCKATIIMPADAPVLKAARVSRSGAKIIRYDRATEDRDEMAREFSKRTGATLIHPYEYREVIAGQGTCGMEIVDQFEQLETKPDRIVVCCGGGGLSAGIALAVHERFPKTKVCTVEPEGFDDYRRSLEAGKILENKATTGSICDALMAPQPGSMSFEINKTHIAESLVVSDQQAMEAIRFAYEELKLVIEPSGAVSIAALLEQKTAWRGETVACVLSGGNIDPDLYTKVLSGNS
ncbi:MAG: threonine/serine dehydratase [Pseudomonadota bacterium]